MSVSLPVVNLATAKFECIFGRGCEGICCKNGRPSVDRAEQKRITKVLRRTLPHLRPEASALIEKEGFTSRRTKLAMPMLRVTNGWCVFFNQGCVLHKVGAEDGDSYQYKPTQCALFPLDKTDNGEWFVRQWGYENEHWDLFCLNPLTSNVSASQSLKAEIGLAARVDQETS